VISENKEEFRSGHRKKPLYFHCVLISIDLFSKYYVSQHIFYWNKKLSIIFLQNKSRFNNRFVLASNARV